LWKLTYVRVGRFVTHQSELDPEFLERAMGIEPTSEAWEASILPLYDARSFSIVVTIGMREQLVFEWQVYDGLMVLQRIVVLADHA
jgi:hypothetical protein